MNLKCIITDDEPIALEILEDYINTVPGIELIIKCKSAMETLTALRNYEIDVLFIDIKMPQITGVEFIKSLKNPPLIVFTTAYPNYAYEGFELDAVDYLLKPISIERFLKTIDKLFTRRYNNTQVVHEGKDKTFFFIKSESDIVKLSFDNVLMVEGLENYVQIHCSDKKYISNITMKNMESLLSDYGFLRVHRSFIVNVSKIKSVRGNVFIMDDKIVPIGKSYRKIVTKVLKEYLFEK